MLRQPKYTTVPFFLKKRSNDCHKSTIYCFHQCTEQTRLQSRNPARQQQTQRSPPPPHCQQHWPGDPGPPQRWFGPVGPYTSEQHSQYPFLGWSLQLHCVSDSGSKQRRRWNQLNQNYHSDHPIIVYSLVSHSQSASILRQLGTKHCINFSNVYVERWSINMKERKRKKTR